jgi:hypothetical protein
MTVVLVIVILGSFMAVYHLLLIYNVSKRSAASKIESYRSFLLLISVAIVFIEYISGDDLLHLCYAFGSIFAMFCNVNCSRVPH